MQRVILYTGLILIFLAAWGTQNESRAETFEGPIRVLFIGNSYTNLTRPVLLDATKVPENGMFEFGFVTPGGMTLARHLENPEVIENIRNGDWDYVVLQDQSQTPALPEGHGKSFQDAVDRFAELIRESGGEPLLFETWGRRDGDAQNPGLFPDYETMQAKLTEAYRTAGERNAIRVAPVGEVWAAVRRVNPRLGLDLYSRDGSHPSGIGARLATAVLLETILERPVHVPSRPGTLSARDRKIIESQTRHVMDGVSPAF